MKERVIVISKLFGVNPYYVVKIRNKFYVAKFYKKRWKIIDKIEN